VREELSAAHRDVVGVAADLVLGGRHARFARLHELGRARLGLRRQGLGQGEAYAIHQHGWSLLWPQCLTEFLDSW